MGLEESVKAPNGHIAASEQQMNRPPPGAILPSLDSWGGL